MTQPEQPITTEPAAIAPENSGIGFGVTSLVTGILACLVGMFFIVSLPLGVVAIIFGTLGMKKPVGRGLAIAGLVTGIIGVAIGVLVLLFIILAAATTPSNTTF